MGKLFAIAAATAFLAGAAPDKAQVSALAWMSGSWISQDEDRWTEESWTAPRGGMMLGASSSGRGETVRDWEHMRIASDEAGVISFWGSPKGAPPVAFRLVSLKGAEAVFENPEHDYPTRISYRREGKMLIATTSGPDGADLQTWRYTRASR